MSLSSLYLDAFVAVAALESFSAAANKLNITQSALSQRIKNLEEDLGLTLFLRSFGGVQLTEQGQKVLRYCQTKDSLETEMLHELNSQSKEGLSGVVRIGAYSSILRSAVIPALAGFLRLNPRVLCEFSSSPMELLPSKLNRNEVDFIIMDSKLDRADVEFDLLGKEKFVVIENKKKSDRNDIFLDNDYNDRTTELFFKLQNSKKIKYRRSYFDDCYGIIDGVEMGLGKAIMSSHLIKNNKNIKVVKVYKETSLDIYLHYHSQVFYSKIHQSIVFELKQKLGLFL